MDRPQQCLHQSVPVPGPPWLSLTLTRGRRNTITGKIARQVLKSLSALNVRTVFLRVKLEQLLIITNVRTVFLSQAGADHFHSSSSQRFSLHTLFCPLWPLRHLQITGGFLSVVSEIYIVTLYNHWSNPTSFVWRNTTY